LSTTRVTIERAFGLFKGRFRRLQYVDTHRIETTVDLIIFCCILHNICILKEDEMMDYFEENNEISLVLEPCTQNDMEGNAKRDNIAGNL